ncbi:MAG: YdeI/OmpD-associated family protein [Gemmatimonadaceae bacterium]
MSQPQKRRPRARIDDRPADAGEARFRANAAAWDFFQARPPTYRRTAIWWVVSAKRDATRERRLATLIEDSAQGRTLAQLTRKST